jgi:hypothetical protein
MLPTPNSEMLPTPNSGLVSSALKTKGRWIKGDRSAADYYTVVQIV